MILSAGEALIDMLEGKTVSGERAYAPHAGGAVMNTAIALARLGTPSGFLTGLSRDPMGEILRRHLSDSQVALDLCVQSDRPTTLAFVRLVQGQASYFFYDENTAGRMLRPEDMPDLPASVSAFFTGGIWLAIEPCGSALQALHERASATCLTMLDPNVRPSFVSDRAAYTARIAAMVQRSDIVKFSDEDFHWLYGDAQPVDLLAQGPKVVLITEGAKGASAYWRSGKISVPAPEVQVVDTVGAGDTFNAGFLAALDRAGLASKAAFAGVTGNDLTAALTLGVKAAAVTCSRAGANPPWADEVLG